jgi:adhesin/invasin
MNWAKLYVRGFIWNAYDGVADMKGNDVSLRAQVPILPGLSIEAGHRSFTDNTPSEDFLKVSYNLMNLNRPKSIQPWFTTKAYSLDSMENKRYEKVRRENIIVKQTSFRIVLRGT